jgi:hypothetical protein
MKADGMQITRDTTIHITSAEWRWVVVFAVALTVLSFLPFLWVAFSGAGGTDWQFMGILNNYRDGATYLSKMEQGTEGTLLINFRHTPEPHSGVLIQVLYPALGQVARLIGIPPIPLFHAARVVASLVMYLALYHLAASIWTRLRTRRIFFILVAIGSGFGWFFSLLTGDTTYPDLSIPEIYPFYSSLVNIHFPLSIACLALLSSVVIVAFRPGSTDDPGAQNGGLAAGLLSFALSLLFPQALLPLGVAIGGYVAVYWFGQRRVTLRELRWLLVVVLPAVPMAAYYVAIVAYNPVIAEWNRQNVTAAPAPLTLLLGLGLPLIIALPGIYRAVRRFEVDGDRLMLLWLVAMIVLMYLPTNIQRRFAAGMMIPIAYFATRSLEDFWFQHVNRRWRYRLLVAGVPLLVITYLFILGATLAVTPGPFLPRDYAAVFSWLKQNTRSGEVVLASEPVSIWVPSWVGASVVYAHPFETLHADEKQAQVLAWYDGSTTDCYKLLQEYNVSYVLVGPQERELGAAACADELNLVLRAGDVNVYAP